MLFLPYKFLSLLFFFNDAATTEIYTLSLHDALPIYRPLAPRQAEAVLVEGELARRRPQNPLFVFRRVHPAKGPPGARADRKSTRLNSSHANISYAVFCLKKKRNLLSIW